MEDLMIVKKCGEGEGGEQVGGGQGGARDKREKPLRGHLFKTITFVVILKVKVPVYLL